MPKSEQKKNKRKAVAIKDAEPKHADPKGGVALGDVNTDGTSDVITGAGAGGGPHVKVFSGNTR